MAALPDFWALANASLLDDRITFDLNNTGTAAIVQDILAVAKKKEQECLENGSRYKNAHGDVVILYDVVMKIIRWVEIFKEIESTAAQYDPGLAALPWSAVRSLLQMPLDDVDDWGALTEGVEFISNLITRGAALEALCSEKPSPEPQLYWLIITKRLRSALIDLYTSIMRYLSAAIKFYQQTTPNQESLGHITDHALQDHLKKITDSRIKVEECGRELRDITFEEAKYYVTASPDNRSASGADLATSHGALIDLIEGLDDPSRPAITRLEDVEDDLTKEERAQIRHWLSNVSYMKHHEAQSAICSPGFCSWLTEKKEFRNWQTSSTSSLLWLHGILGSGKSVLTSSVVDKFYRSSGVNPLPAPVAYFYCSRDPTETERAEPVEIMRCIVEQLTSSGERDLPIREPVERRFMERDPEKIDPMMSRMDLDESVETILELLKENPATIVIDALDECDPQTRGLLLSKLDHLVQNSSRLLKVFVTSRDDQDIIDHFANSPSVHISTEGNKLSIFRYVRSRIEDAIDEKRFLSGDVPEKLRLYVIERLSTQASGMFRLVNVHVETLCNPQKVKTEADVYRVLEGLPEKLHESYDLVLSQILNFESPTREMADRVLTWLLCSKQRLPTERFISIINAGSSDEGHPPTKSDILSACHNLVVLDSAQDSFRFAHTSVREYLESTWDINARHGRMVEECVYGCFDKQYHSGPLQSMHLYSKIHGDFHHRMYHRGPTVNPLSERLKKWLRNFFFECLSFPKWIANSKNARQFSEFRWRETVKCLLNQDLDGQLQRFVDSANPTDAADSNVAMHKMLMKLVIMEDFWEKASEGHLAPYFLSLGMDDLTLFMLKMGAWINDRDKAGRGVLTYAINAKNDHMVIKLLDRGADCLLRDNDGLPDFHRAARIGYEFAVQQLLDAGVSANSSSEDNNTPLMEAAAYGHSSIVRLLLGRGTDISHKNYVGENALHLAVGRRDIPTIQLLADADPANIDISNHLQMTALHLAANYGDTDVVSLLLSAGADFTKKNRDGEIAVQIAAGRGHIDTVEVLLEAETDPNTKLDSTIKAWYSAVNNGQVSLVKELSNPAIPVSDPEVRVTLLDVADKAHLDGFYETGEFLIHALDNIDAQDEAGDTTLHHAANNSSPNLVKILLHLGANTEVQNKFGETALHIAARRGSEKSLELLLDAGADPEVTTFETRYTALHKAAEAGQLGATKVLVERGANINAELSGGETAAHLALTKDSDAVASYLIDKME